MGENVVLKNNDDETILHKASCNRNIDMMTEIVSIGLSINDESSSNWKPIHYASFSNNGCGIRKLVGLGADIEAKTDMGMTSFHIASSIYENGFQSLEELSRLGADINARDEDNRTPLHYAVADHSLVLIEELVHYGADINTKDDKGQTPIEDAYKSGNKTLEGHLKTIGFI